MLRKRLAIYCWRALMSVPNSLEFDMFTLKSFQKAVISAQAEIYVNGNLDSRLRGNDVGFTSSAIGALDINKEYLCVRPLHCCASKEMLS